MRGHLVMATSDMSLFHSFSAHVKPLGACDVGGFADVGAFAGRCPIRRKSKRSDMERLLVDLSYAV